jgi:23S rRNA (pseudouridine1915-N3)-methyltransferase
MPSWVNDGVADYTRRLRPPLTLEIVEVAPVRRRRGVDVRRVVEEEGRRLLKATAANEVVIALDQGGRTMTTEQLAADVRRRLNDGRNLALLVGGADGLSAACRQRADAIWSLSPLTLAHPLVRVVVAEQVYRVWSVLEGHPYHRRGSWA